MLTTNGDRGGGKNLKMVRKRYSDLNDLICELPSKLSEISSDIDSEFLSAYRTHMLEVQRDLQSLKQQVHEIINHNVLTPSKHYAYELKVTHVYARKNGSIHELRNDDVYNNGLLFNENFQFKIAVAEAALHDDRAVATLENEVNWFSGEISQLKSHAVNTRKDIARTLISVSSLNEEIILLNDELKQVLKHSTVLETEINETSMLLISNRDNSSKRATSRSTLEEQIYRPKSQTSTMTSKQLVNNLNAKNIIKTCPTPTVQSSSYQSLSLSQENDSQYNRNTSRAFSANTTIKNDARSLVDELLSDRYDLTIFSFA